MLAYEFAKFGKWVTPVSLALCEQGPKLAPKGAFPILAGGSRSRGAQTGREFRPTTAQAIAATAQSKDGNGKCSRRDSDFEFAVSWLEFPNPGKFS